MTDNNDNVHRLVEDRYAAFAVASEAGLSACEPGSETWGIAHYDDLGELPDGAVLASLGCGNPTVVADLRPGDRVLDLGSGGGIDVLLSAKRVGPTGFVYGLDMTVEMLDLARGNAAEVGAQNVEFLEGMIEHVPLPDGAVNVVISNCVINLSPDKPAVFAEMFRVLRPGGRIGVSDVVTDDHLTDEERVERSSYVDCIVGAMPIGEYEAGLRRVGFSEVTIIRTNFVGDGVHAAIIQAVKPATQPAFSIRSMTATDWPAVQSIYEMGIATDDATFDVDDSGRRLP
jgi:arsenite methyltransferase